MSRIDNDTLTSVLLDLDVSEIKNLCSSKQITKICNNNKFWEQKLAYDDLPIIGKPSTSDDYEYISQLKLEAIVELFKGITLKMNKPFKNLLPTDILTTLTNHKYTTFTLYFKGYSLNLKLYNNKTLTYEQIFQYPLEYIQNLLTTIMYYPQSFQIAY